MLDILDCSGKMYRTSARRTHKMSQSKRQKEKIYYIINKKNTPNKQYSMSVPVPILFFFNEKKWKRGYIPLLTTVIPST